MREIKYRAWVKKVYENGELEYGGYMIDNIHSINFTKITNLMLGVTPIGISYYRPSIYFGSVEKLGAEEIELMQFTGLRDYKRTEIYPDGQEIYENDIIKDHLNNQIGIVEWQQSICAFTVFSGRYLINSLDSQYWEVIGNIHENPDLIKK